MTNKARSIAVWTTLIGIVVLILAAAAFHRQILEVWHLKRLSSDDPEVVADAAQRLAGMGSIKGLAALLRLPDNGAWEELNASYSTETLSENSATVLEEVIAAFDEKDPALHERAASLLERLGPSARPGIVRVLRHSSGLSGEVTVKVIEIFSRLVVGAPEMMEDVIDALEGREHYVRLAIQYVIQSAVLKAPEILPRLLDGLGDPSILVRVKIAETIGSLGERASRRVADLGRAVPQAFHEDRDRTLRAFAKGSDRLGDLDADDHGWVTERVEQLREDLGRSQNGGPDGVLDCHTHIVLAPVQSIDDVLHHLGRPDEKFAEDFDDLQLHLARESARVPQHLDDARAGRRTEPLQQRDRALVERRILLVEGRDHLFEHGGGVFTQRFRTVARVQLLPGVAIRQAQESGEALDRSQPGQSLSRVSDHLWIVGVQPLQVPRFEDLPVKRRGGENENDDADRRDPDGDRTGFACHGQSTRLYRFPVLLGVLGMSVDLLSSLFFVVRNRFTTLEKAAGRGASNETLSPVSGWGNSSRAACSRMCSTPCWRRNSRFTSRFP